MQTRPPRTARDDRSNIPSAFLRRAAGMLLVGFALVCGALVVAGELPGDHRVLVEIHRAVGQRAQEHLVTVADLTDVTPLAAVAVGLVASLLAMRRWSAAVRVTVGVSVVWAVNPLLKELFARDRPRLWPSPGPVSEYSFPSGHAAGTAALFGTLVMVAWHTRLRTPAVVLGVLVVALVGISQLALGVHYPSDVLAGWLWAAGWISFVWSRPRGRPPDGPSRAESPRARDQHG